MPTHHHRSLARWSTVASLAVVVVGLLGAVPLAGTGPAQVAFPAAPAPGRFVVDEARLIEPLHQVDIEGLAGELKREHGYPVTVVTIRSLSSHGAGGYTIERYASEMLKGWPPDADRQGYGLTLLVSADDQLARIELGSAWRGVHDGRAREIMDHLILPAFRRGEFSKGILAAVKGFDAMGRGRRLPGESRFGWLIPAALAPADQPWWLMPAIAAVCHGARWRRHLARTERAQGPRVGRCRVLGRDPDLASDRPGQGRRLGRQRRLGEHRRDRKVVVALRSPASAPDSARGWPPSRPA